MNAIVRSRYPVENLPEDLREGLAEHGWVRIEITPEQADLSRKPGDLSEGSLLGIVERARRLRAAGKVKRVTTEDAVARVRALRDEWNS